MRKALVLNVAIIYFAIVTQSLTSTKETSHA
jgi:hypothetical protein